jgi:hypothetical protein
MSGFHIFYLRDSVLQSSETLTDADLLDAIDRAFEKSQGATAEVWSDLGRVGIVDGGNRPIQGARSPEEAPIMAVMRERLKTASNVAD